MIVSLAPKLKGIAIDRFIALAKELQRKQRHRNYTDFNLLCEAEVQWCRTHPYLGEERQVYEASARVLIDLARLSWEIHENGLGIELHSPQFPHREHVSLEDIQADKRRVQQELEPLWNSQFQNDAVREFIQRLEQPHPSTNRKPVTNLIADGQELSTRLKPSLNASDEERQERLSEAIQPYLQLVESGVKDEFTGLLLGDIWRYFRYTWRIPQSPIPGRQLLYLVRDKAHPCHAVIGIASLNNSALQMPKRDEWFGWTVDAFEKRIQTLLQGVEPDKHLIQEYQWLMQNVESALDGIDPTDLIVAEERQNPTEDVIARLRRRSEYFARLREEVLKEWAHAENEQPGMLQETEASILNPPPVSDEVLSLEGKNFSLHQAQGHRIMVAKKRAFEFARLLQAKMHLLKYERAFKHPQKIEQLFFLDEFRVVISTILGAIKSVRVGTNILEITTCGAIPPYNYLLGGKLAALLMLSPQVAADYQKRYGNEPSIISSQLKNAEVVRDATLVYLGTTSLYALGSSQYNRLHLPAGTIAPDQPEFRFQCIGETTGYGTVQFCADTVRAIEDVLEHVQGFKHINSIFGEGHSPRLRKLTAGLNALGFPSDSLLRHNQKRLIYGVPLCEQTIDFLCGRNAKIPDYLCRPEQYSDGSSRIIDFWRCRWLVSRLNYEPAMVNLMLAKPWKLSEKIPLTYEPSESQQPTGRETGEQYRTPVPSNEGIEFWQRLAMSGSNVTSDELTPEELERLHISQPLEAFIIEKVQDGFSIILTGNAGDGKTHLLKQLEKSLYDCGAIVEPDATAAMRYGDVTPILNNWRKAIEQGKPYCLAANEYPLYQIRIKGRGILPAIKEVDRQCRNRLVYGGEEEHDAFCEHIIVIDLSLRNPLAPRFAKSMLHKMLSDQALHHYAEQQTDPVFIRNFVRLSEPYIQERLLNLFERIVRRGQRTTIRELWILLSRLLFGSDKKANTDQTFKAWYSTRLFEFDSRFGLTALLKEYCDPTQYSHPQWDLQLERLQRDSGEEWQFGLPQLPIQTEIVEKSFTEIKRAFYFEHKRGEEAFALEEPYVQEFQRILSDAEQDDTIAKANLVASINACYCPVKFPGVSDALMLWSGHRFHEQPTKSYIACQRVPTSDLTIALPRLPDYLQGQFDYQADHFELGYTRGNQRARLLIDFSLYATLCKLKDGFPRKLLPERDINRLDLFMEQLHRLGIEQSRAFICFNVEQYSAARIRLSSSGKTYQEVELYG